jgi:hypothetical protein
LKERDHSEDRGIGGRMGLEWSLGDWLGECRAESVGSG